MSTLLKCVGALAICALTLTDADAHHRVPQPMQNVVLSVCHPCTGCNLDVPVCIPVCCQGAPCVRFERTLIGHGRTVFSWQCGHTVTVRYTHSGYNVHQRG